MTGTVLEIDNLVVEDNLGCRIAQFWHTWDMSRQTRISEWKEIRNYVYATDTSRTTNSSLPWKNTTHIPKLCQIRDNLYANYMASMFPKRKWLVWEGDDEENQDKQEVITNYMQWVVDQRWFKEEMGKLVLDYIDYGVCFATVEWVDERVERPDKEQVGYVGPKIRRINPLDIVFNPVASTFNRTPKIVRSLITMGELKKVIEGLSTDQEAYDEAKAIFNYIKNVRQEAAKYTGVDHHKDEFYNVDGFDSFKHYLDSNLVELLTFYGDYYDEAEDELYENYKIVVVDRHKVLYKEPAQSYLGYPTFASAVWRTRQDNLWGMGPLDNLIGMQYRIDSIENQKADMVDLTTVPPLKIKGYVEDFEWGPMEKIYVGDDGDVDVLLPDFNPVATNIEIQSYEQRMEEMSGSPKEAMGFRTPGEKTKYEVQRLENAASRIFQNKIGYFEEQVTEPLLNFMLDLAARNMSKTVIRVIDDEFQLAVFQELTAVDLTGSGRIKPVAARHFAEKAEFVQNINQFYASGIGMDPEVRLHLSSVKLAEMVNTVLDAEQYDMFTPFIRLQEQAEAQKLQGVQQEEVLGNAMTPAGMSEDEIELTEEDFANNG
jgi:hypothetical protein